MKPHSAAQPSSEGLNELGIDYLFCNFGTDHAPLIEAMAGFKRDGRKAPVTTWCRTKSRRCTSSGHAMATGRGQRHRPC